MPPVEETAARERIRTLLRIFMSDTPELNRLIREEEYNQDKMDLAINMAIDEYNITPPPLGNLSVANYPSLFLLIHGSAIQLLKMGGILQSRNELNYSSGGVTVRTFDKTQLYQSWIANFMQEYKRLLQNYKIAQNIAGAFGAGVNSEYNIIAWYW